MKAVRTKKPENATVDFDAIPSHQSDAVSRTLIGCVSRLFENPAVMADYKRWQKEHWQKEKGSKT